MLTPIIVPLGAVQIPLQSQEPNPGYHQYQIHTQYQVPDMQQLPLSDPRGLNHIPPGVLPPELRNLPQLTMEMRPPRMGPQPMMGPQNNPMMGPQVSLVSVYDEKCMAGVCYAQVKWALILNLPHVDALNSSAQVNAQVGSFEF
jgi:hypothetical protein